MWPQALVPGKGCDRARLRIQPFDLPEHRVSAGSSVCRRAVVVAHGSSARSREVVVRRATSRRVVRPGGGHDVVPKPPPGRGRSTARTIMRKPRARSGDGERTLWAPGLRPATGTCLRGDGVGTCGDGATGITRHARDGRPRRRPRRMLQTNRQYKG